MDKRSRGNWIMHVETGVDQHGMAERRKHHYEEEAKGEFKKRGRETRIRVDGDEGGQQTRRNRTLLKIFKLMVFTNNQRSVTLCTHFAAEKNRIVSEFIPVASP